MRLLPSLLALLFLAGCGGPSLAPSQVSLSLDFNANSLLELWVLAESSVSCGDLLGGAAPDGDGVVRHALERKAASALNDGGAVTFEVEDLPAEEPLVFYARALDGAELLSHDCEGEIVIPAGGEVSVQLGVREAP